jgi:signal transduction histidine kinase/ActR/RegA family two-component response regulator
LQAAFGASIPLRNLAAVGQGDVLQLQAPAPEPDGPRWFRVAADPVVDDDHQPTGAVLVITDITATKRTEAAMRKSNQDLLEANRMKDEFLATLSHELRTPLNAMLGWTRLLRAGRLDERASLRALDTIERNASLQAKLIDDLLDVSRIITGKLRLKIATIDPISVIEAAINSVRPAADAKGIRLEAELDPATGVMLADGDRLQQVMWNLLSNAIKFTPACGSVRVRLSCSERALRIEVHDTGTGIAPQFLPFVFDRFRQADSSTTRSHGGLGLGLAIVRHLVELHGGTVAVDSAGVGLGASFTLALPLSPRGERLQVSAPLLDLPLQTPEPKRTQALDGMRVLILDDEEDARELLSAAFSQMGALSVAAASVDEALRLWESERPQVIVSDIAMPGQDGYAFARRLRVREAELGPLYGLRVPMIAVTAYATSDDTRRAHEAGYDLHVAKPVDASRLAAAIHEVLRRGSALHDANTLPIILDGSEG